MDLIVFFVFKEESIVWLIFNTAFQNSATHCHWLQKAPSFLSFHCVMLKRLQNSETTLRFTLCRTEFTEIWSICHSWVWGDGIRVVCFINECDSHVLHCVYCDVKMLCHGWLVSPLKLNGYWSCSGGTVQFLPCTDDYISCTGLNNIVGLTRGVFIVVVRHVINTLNHH